MKHYWKPYKGEIGIIGFTAFIILLFAAFLLSSYHLFMEMENSIVGNILQTPD